MTGNIKTFTVTIGRDIQRASALGFPCVDLIYSPTPEGIKPDAQPTGKGGLMGLYSQGQPLGGVDAEKVASEIGARVKRRGYGGVVLDIPVSDDGAAFISRLCPFLASMAIVHYVPVELASRAPQAKLLVPSAISGGSFAEMIEHFSSLYSPSRLCLELIRTRNDFEMPSVDSSGKALSRQEFDYLLEQSGGGYYSTELCCRYFTYMDGKTPHFVMYDDKTSARQKAEMAARAGFFGLFALYGEWGEDINFIFQ